jgi:hypothetical protein
MLLLARTGDLRRVTEILGRITDRHTERMRRLGLE